MSMCCGCVCMSAPLVTGIKRTETSGQRAWKKNLPFLGNFLGETNLGGRNSLGGGSFFVNQPTVVNIYIVSSDVIYYIFGTKLLSLKSACINVKWCSSDVMMWCQAMTRDQLSDLEATNSLNSFLAKKFDGLSTLIRERQKVPCVLH